MTFVRVVLLAALMAVATCFAGWITLPALAAVYAVLVRARSAPGEAALAALIGWGVLLARVSMVPAFTTLLSRLGGIFPIPGVAVALGVTLLFAVVLAWSAARVVVGVLPLRCATVG